MIDVVPTILEASGIQAPEIVDGIRQSPIEGTSFLYTFDKANANAPTRHKTQYFEMMGQWALYDDGWLLSTKVNRAPWEAFGPANAGSAQQPGVPALRPAHELQPDRRRRREVSAEGEGDAGEVRRRGEEVPGVPDGRVGGGPHRRAAPEHHGGPAASSSTRGR